MLFQWVKNCKCFQMYVWRNYAKIDGKFWKSDLTRLTKNKITVLSVISVLLNHNIVTICGLNLPLKCHIFTTSNTHKLLYYLHGHLIHALVGLFGTSYYAFALPIFPRTFIWQHHHTPRTRHLPWTQTRVLRKHWLKTPKMSWFTILGGSVLRGLQWTSKITIYEDTQVLRRFVPWQWEIHSKLLNSY